jgi:hypothetical protein
MDKKNVTKQGKELSILMNKYMNQGNCCFDFLGYEKVPAGLTFEEAFEIYVGMMQMVEADRFIHIRDLDDISEYKMREDGSQEERKVRLTLAQ